MLANVVLQGRAGGHSRVKSWKGSRGLRKEQLNGSSPPPPGGFIRSRAAAAERALSESAEPLSSNEIFYPKRGEEAGDRSYYLSLPVGVPQTVPSTPAEFWKIVHACIDQAQFKAVKEEDVVQVRPKFKLFRRELIGDLSLGGDFTASGDHFAPTLENWRIVYARKGKTALRKLVTKEWKEYAGLTETPDYVKRTEILASSVDTRFPQEWYTSARQMKRRWHLHVGPTNSGKTYNALKRLEETKNGIYAGPLRLLAYEIFEKMNSKGIPCNLVTGDDIRIVDTYATVESSTMEMVDVATEYEVCVIDEIQMIGDESRGWAWTQAVLGVKAKEVHMCGEERVVDLITKLAASVGDELIVHRYKRLGPLEVLPKSLEGNLKRVEKGDCVVTFSRRNIFALKRTIEEKTGKRCAVIYGGLPPETRTLQAQLFNDPNSEYDILVASDAVGMGLNLSVKRIIFEAIEKWNGKEIRPIEVPSIKQIAGRAGRYKVAVPSSPAPQPEGNQSVVPLPAAPSTGYVTTLDKTDLKGLHIAMSTDPKPITKAGVLPLNDHISRFAAQLPEGEAFSVVLKKLAEFMKESPIFTPCSLEEMIEVARIYDDIKVLSVPERMTLIMAPIGRTPASKFAALKMAEAVAYGENGSILHLKGIDLEILDNDPKTNDDLMRLEQLHKILIQWLWLS